MYKPNLGKAPTMGDSGVARPSGQPGEGAKKGIGSNMPARSHGLSDVGGFGSRGSSPKDVGVTRRKAGVSDVQMKKTHKPVKDC